MIRQIDQNDKPININSNFINHAMFIQFIMPNMLRAHKKKKNQEKNINILIKQKIKNFHNKLLGLESVLLPSGLYWIWNPM